MPRALDVGDGQHVVGGGGMQRCENEPYPLSPD